MPATPFTIVSDEQLLAAHAPGEPFEVEVDGDQTSFLGQVRCAWFEWVYGSRQAGQLASYSVAYHSDAPLLLLAGGKRAAVPAGRVRVYASPAIEKEHRPGDASAPEVVKARLAKDGKPVYVAEYRLEAGRKYHACVHEDVHHLPPQGPGKPPKEARRLVLRISDKPFKDGAPQVELTPSYRGRTY